MKAASALVDAFLVHYASEYYDPAKAREYYLRTRELKGRQSMSGLKTEKKKQAWQFAKKNISEAKKAELEAAAEAHKELVSQARDHAKSVRESISEKLKEILEKVSSKQSEVSDSLASEKKSALEQIATRHKAEAERIRAEAEKKISAVPPVPKGLPDDLRAKLTAKRAEKIDRLRGDSSKKLDDLSTQTKAEKDSVNAATADKREALADYSEGLRDDSRGSAKAQREEVGVKLKESVDKARADYDSRKESLKADYEAKAQKEYDAIKKSV